MAHILSIAQSVPEHCIVQKGFAAHVAKASGLTAPQTQWLEKVYSQSAITTRYSVLEEFSCDCSKWSFWNNGPPSSQERNDLYKEHAPNLSKNACQKAINAWGQDPQKITHIIYVSCTAVVAPGIQAYLQEALHLSTDVCQFGLNMMGCFGAFKGLQMASAFCSQNPNNRVLVVCCELCSLHFQQTQCQEAQIGNALFADASAACIVALEPTRSEKSLYRICQHKSQILPETRDKMTWDLSNSGLVFGLKKEVPELIKTHVASFATSFLTNDISIHDCLWPIHPGGKGILQAVEEALTLSKTQTTASWQVLKDYGNISSASYLFVLNQLLQQKPEKKWAVGLGFGPGLCFEGMLLEIM